MVKLRDGSTIRARDGRPTEQAPAPPGLAPGLAPGPRAADVADLFAAASGRWTPAFRIPEATLSQLREDAQRGRGRAIGDLNAWFRVFLPPGRAAADAIDALNALESVEVALPVTTPPPPPLPPDFEAQQTFLNDAPGGVGARAAWLAYGLQGAGVRVADLEYSWNLNHLDLPPITHLGPPPLDPFSSNSHGTSVLGIMASIDNGWGTTGVSPSSEYFTAAVYTDVDGVSVYDLASAILLATIALQPGDIILIEQQTFGPNAVGGASQFGLVPSEWVLTVYDAIQIALGNGLIVVEAAGNGSQDLDDPIYSVGHNGHWPFLPENDSGAIIVGAGTLSLSPALFTNSGSTVDLQGLGSNVWTTGNGSAYAAEGADLAYTDFFGGTSSAAAIVAGAVALFQASYQSQVGEVLGAQALTQWLQLSGSTPFSTLGGSSVNIGPLPDVAGAIDLATRPIHISISTPLPQLITPGVPFSFEIEVTDGLSTLVPGTERLRSRVNGGPFLESPLEPVPGFPSRFLVTPPIIYCAETLEFFIEAQASDGAIATNPSQAPNANYAPNVGTLDEFTLLDEGFENGLPLGWTASDLWHVTNQCSPGPSCQGSNWAYFGIDGVCNYHSGVSVGTLAQPHTLFPPIDPSGSIQMEICHSLNTENVSGFDTAELTINGSSFIPFSETNGWATVTHNLTFLADSEFTLGFRFDTKDNLNNMFRGWQIDHVKIFTIDTICEDFSPCPADCMGRDSVVGVEDFLALLANWGRPSRQPCDIAPTPGGDGLVGIDDFLLLLSSWGPCVE